MSTDIEITKLEKEWAQNPRWSSLKRPYPAEEVLRLRGSVRIEHTLARQGAEKLWQLLHHEPFVNALGALTGTREAINKLVAARLAADVLGVPTVLIARTDAEAADLLTSDIDPHDKPHCTGERTNEGFYRTKPGLPQAISRGLAYAPYADLLWCETAKPDLAYARAFAEAIHQKFPGKLLAYNCSPSFNWKQHLDDATIGKFQKELASLGYRFQFITLAGFHSLNYSMFHLAHGYAHTQMSAFVALQEQEFAAANQGFTAVKHQREVGTGYFDAITQTIEGTQSSTTALKGSTEDAQFLGERKKTAGH